MSKKLLFISPGNYSFVLNDLAVLKKHYTVKELPFVTQPKTKWLKSFFTQLWVLCTGEYDIIYSWFADYHSVFPALVGFLRNKKVVIIIGGYDAAKNTTYNYGAHLHAIRSYCVSISCRFATHVLPVSDYTHNQLLKNARFKIPVYKLKRVYNMADVEYFTWNNLFFEKQPVVLCIAKVHTEAGFYIKGIDFLLKVAQHLPTVSFKIVGLSGVAHQMAAQNTLGNVSLIPPVEREALRNYYAEASVIVQFSRMESFGVALAEAMCMGCVPITVAGLGSAEVINIHAGGYLIHALNESEAMQAITHALNTTHQQRIQISKYATENFNASRRERELLQILQTVHF